VALHLPKRTSGNLECRLIDARRFAGRCGMQLDAGSRLSQIDRDPPAQERPADRPWNVTAVGISERSNERRPMRPPPTSVIHSAPTSRCASSNRTRGRPRRAKCVSGALKRMVVMSPYGPSVWTGRALQAESDDLERLVLRFCIRLPSCDSRSISIATGSLAGNVCSSASSSNQLRWASRREDGLCALCSIGMA
jgi:hypothetical protein